MSMSRRAACRCGQLSAICEGDPVRVSVCHCLDCQRRSGSAFAAQARFPAEKVKIAGDYKTYTHTGDSGAEAYFNFCPLCGSTLFYTARPYRELIAVPLGAFADPGFPGPDYSVYESRRHRWATIAGDGIEHFD
jgi:hypothetical protein